ncbi:shikimate kinase [Rubritalea marina]|uniref:shikimate kinase n=1 Tax=Rubritalea marina TaxID=361055 RepID=UPI000373C623|nr:shikimate kinase [Rubritalea marina]
MPEEASPCCPPAKNIILVGFMGSGKSTIGRELGQLLSYPLIDTDAVVEEEQQISISDIFSLKGEPYFRDCETAAVQKLLGDCLDHHIIATGGGLPLREENRKLLRELGYVVWLDATPDSILERTARSTNRPLLQTENPRETIESMLHERNAIYKDAAHLRLQTSGLSISETAHGILESARYFFGQS